MPVPVRQSLPERGLDGWSAASKNLKNIAPTLLQSAAAPGFLGQLFGWQQDGISDLIQATPIATNLPQSFFCRPAEQVAPELIGQHHDFGIEMVQALDAAHAQDIARAQHPTGRLSAVPAELLDGQDRHKLLMAWLRGEG